MADKMFTSIEITTSLMRTAGIQCFKQRNYEADDLIFACVQAAKRDYPGMPIDIVTNDADILPLVDDTVSVFIRSKKMTYAIRKDLEKAHYIQVTPENYRQVVEDMSAYKKFYVPYNTILFHKLVRGDSSDKIGGIKKLFPPKRYNALIQEMESDGVDPSRVFRYGECTKKYIKRVDRSEVTKEYALEHRDECAVAYGEPKELTVMMDVLERYIDEEEVLDHIRKTYLGMNLNQAYLGYKDVSRVPARISEPIAGFNQFRFKEEALKLGIQLRML
jgi:DNA polymerase-1